MMSLLTCLYSLLFFIKSIEAACNVAAQEFPNEEKCLSPILPADTYAMAYQFCDAHGAEVVKIENIFDNVFVTQNLLQSNQTAPTTHIGVQRTATGDWIYADGGPLTYSNWANGEPNMTNPQKQCAVLNRIDGKWSMEDCSVSRPYYCSYHESINGNFCPTGWIYSNITQLCYYVQNLTSPNVEDWQLFNRSAAEAACHRMNGHLASIHSKEENNFIYDLIATNVRPDGCDLQWAWIGLNGTGGIGDGQWIDGTPVDFSGAPVEYATPSLWVMSNDPGCVGKEWGAASQNARTARFVCRKA